MTCYLIFNLHFIIKNNNICNKRLLNKITYIDSNIKCTFIQIIFKPGKDFSLFKQAYL